MRQALVALSAVVLASPAVAQELEIPEAGYPALPGEAQTLQAFAPRGWVIEAQASGDLNGDGKADAVLVLHGTDPRLVVETTGLGEPHLDTNPRILAVAFAKAGGGYRLALQNHSLIPRRTNPVVDDPFDSVTGGGVAVRGQSVRVELGFFMSAGGWGMFRVTYTFRWQHERLELIGYDRSDTQRNSGETRSVSINYSTGRVKIATGSIENDRQNVVWKSVTDRRLRSIDEIGDGLEFDSGFGE